MKLHYAVECRKGAALLVGEHGLGKTYLTHVLEIELAENYRPFVRVQFPACSPGEMLAHLAVRLGAPDLDGPLRVDRCVTQIEQQLLEWNSQKRHPVLVVDEAHLLDTAHLQTLQLLLNFQGNRPQPEGPEIDFTLILVGRPELVPQVQRVQGLSHRISVRTALRPLTPEESLEYVRLRLRAAGADDQLIQSESLQTLWELSHGTPRRINQIADLSLLVGMADERHNISPIDLETAAAELIGRAA